MQPKHLLTGEELSAHEINAIIATAIRYKETRKEKKISNTLQGHQLALLFDKPSLRTRFSFAIAIQELGGGFIESVSSTRKSETPEDQARVLHGYCHAIMVRTHDDEMLMKMSHVSKVPIINGLSNGHHPCQILGDLLTLQEKFGKLKGVTLAYIGDGNNILHSLLLLAPLMGVNIHYCCPPTRGPTPAILEKAQKKLDAETGTIQAFNSPTAAVKNVNAIYTDVWTSMGFENKVDEKVFQGFQVNEDLMQKSLPDAVFMHCLPMVRGKEVSKTLADQPCSVVFQQSENRLHIQKAILLHLLRDNKHD